MSYCPTCHQALPNPRLTLEEPHPTPREVVDQIARDLSRRYGRFLDEIRWLVSVNLDPGTYAILLPTTHMNLFVHEVQRLGYAQDIIAHIPCDRCGSLTSGIEEGLCAACNNTLFPGVR